MLGMVMVVFVLGAWGDPPTAWRILPAKRYYDNDGPWLVSELQVFASSDCTGDPIPAAKAIGSFPDNLRFAVDGTRETIWTSVAYTAGYGGERQVHAPIKTHCNGCNNGNRLSERDLRHDPGAD